MGPRSGDRGEIVTSTAKHPTQRSLQWGRGPETAESPLNLTLTKQSLPLQWGRGPETAERRQAPAQRPGAPCFNGAAVRRPRRAAHCRPVATFPKRLQWGRGPETAERSAKC